MQRLKWIDKIPLDGQELYPAVEAENVVRVSDLLIKSVGFVSRLMPCGSEGHVPSHPGGTAFVVGVQVDENWGLAHLVTARHVAEAIEPAEAVFLMNGKDGRPLFLRTGETQWFYHPTDKDSVDVAVMPFGSPRFEEYDVTWIPDNLFATDERINEFSIGLGDELVIIGLFTEFFGSTRFTPIVRTGNIAMMPPDKIPVKGFGDMEAYLAEGRSIGGLSGSPVFVRNTVTMRAQSSKGEPGHMHGLGSLHLLGLMHGHWDLPATFADTVKAEAVNMGVSIVTPAKKILETLHHPDLVALRKKHCEDEKQGRPVTDAAFAKPFTRQDFEDALRRVSRKKSDET